MTCAVIGVFGVALLLYDAVFYPWSPYSLFSPENLFGNSLVNGGLFLLVLLFFRLWVLRFLLYGFFRAIEWYYYLGPLEVVPIWTDDLTPDAP
jgi:hypothetical protein